MNSHRLEEFMKIKPTDPAQLSDEARRSVTDFVFLLLEGERKRKLHHLKFVQYIVDIDFNGPINALSENIADMMRYHSFDMAYNMLVGRLGNLGMGKQETIAAMLGALLPLLDKSLPLPGVFGVTSEDVGNVLASLGEGREWRNYGKG